MTPARVGVGLPPGLPCMKRETHLLAMGIRGSKLGAPSVDSHLG